MGKCDGYSLPWAYKIQTGRKGAEKPGRAASQGMFFGIFILNRVSNLSFFVLIRILIYQFLS